MIDALIKCQVSILIIDSELLILNNYEKILISKLLKAFVANDYKFFIKLISDNVLHSKIYEYLYELIKDITYRSIINLYLEAKLSKFNDLFLESNEMEFKRVLENKTPKVYNSLVELYHNFITPNENTKKYKFPEITLEQKNMYLFILLMSEKDLLTIF